MSEKEFNVAIAIYLIVKTWKVRMKWHKAEQMKPCPFYYNEKNFKCHKMIKESVATAHNLNLVVEEEDIKNA